MVIQSGGIQWSFVWVHPKGLLLIPSECLAAAPVISIPADWVAVPFGNEGGCVTQEEEGEMCLPCGIPVHICIQLKGFLAVG